MRYSAVDDSRRVWLSPPQIADLLEACEPWFQPLILTAITTGIDRAPLLRLRAKDLQLAYNSRAALWHGTLFAKGHKNDSRPRTVTIVDPVCRALLPLVQGKDPEERVFDGPPETMDTDERARPLPMTT